jgi:hypothetical protein
MATVSQAAPEQEIVALALKRSTTRSSKAA